MSLLAEELVEEWLNRQGFFTIRGIKKGVQEMDLLAIQIGDDGSASVCRHLEVQASVRPVSYVTKVPRAVQKATGRAPGSSKRRTPEELAAGVSEWIDKKFLMKSKESIRSLLVPGGKWSFELVVHRIKHPEELQCISDRGVVVHRLSDIVRELKDGKARLPGASGSSFVDLVLFGES